RGQRKGLGVGGTQEPLFVIETDVKKNIIYTGQGKNHPGLYRKALLVKSKEVHWIRPDLALKVGDSIKISARIRYRQPLNKAMIYCTEEGIHVWLYEMQEAKTHRQFVTLYQ